eukprot:3034817-Prymnesium_polylepis.1
MYLACDPYTSIVLSLVCGRARLHADPRTQAADRVDRRMDTEVEKDDGQPQGWLLWSASGYRMRCCGTRLVTL